ncbi:MAG: acetyl-CoA carboxylase carboxyl transferase subunit alpha [Candidatus Marinimicrobia bacterium]|nr:acetyl-CoA carboxylase carboxyl transferase subunit alpha [Candidatus Neomarinimicrobiota bacterium]|tara:strand:+ start:2886 stop:3851 length:966 start_codon:yes stop_codon:yes gene_type:complete
MDNSKYILEFEQPLKDIEDRIESLKLSSINTGVDVSSTLQKMEYELSEKRKEIYESLSRWERVQLARHPKRPYSVDYISKISSYWFELHGDRNFSDDPAIVAGIAIIDTIKLVIIAQEKGRGTKEKVFRNFGMPRPEGYRKAMRIMKLAEKFNFPIVTLLDTPGAYPGIGAEERGQGQAIAQNLLEMSQLKVPIISIVIGEGASGGALGIGLADKIICLENTWYSVISPEGCASILFRDAGRAKEAADAMQVTSYDLYKMGIADEIIKEPKGSAHIDPIGASEALKETIIRNYTELKKFSSDELIDRRIEKYNKIGEYDRK